MAQSPSFPSRFAGPPPPPQFRCFPPFRGPPPPPAAPPPFPAFPGRGGLPPPPPTFPQPPPPPHLPPWPRPHLAPPPPPAPEQPSSFSPWRPEASALPDGEPRPRPAPQAGPAKQPPRGSDSGGGGDPPPWLGRWVARLGAASRGEAPTGSPPAFGPSQAARVAAEALRQVARLSALCGAWRARGDRAGAQEVAEGEALLAGLRETVRPLLRGGEGPGSPLAQLRRRLERSRKKRLRRRQGRQEARGAREEEAARVAEKEAQIERWRARRAQEVEDRHREQELKAAADSVLSEVRKKQADTKRVAEILRGLEKLRKLRKEAAGRKGVCPPPAADEAFENEIQTLRTSLKKRTELYEAEERALRVMLEGEQEEERKRELEKKQKKEKEKLLQQKREMDSKLFGDPDEFPLTRILEPYTQYHLQAEYSASALIQIRHEWDRYLVPTDHPEGHFIPPGWVLPSPPSNDVWATAVR